MDNMLTLAENPAEILTNSLWEKWKTQGHNSQPNSLTWMEINNLAKYYVQLCTKTGSDYRDFDFETIVDHTLNFYENKSLIENTVGQPQETQTQEALSELNEHLKENYGVTVTKTLKPKIELEDTVKELKQQLKEATQKPTPPPQPQTIIKEVIIHDSAQYSQPELIEIFEYMQKRHTLKYKITKAFANKKHVLRDRTDNLKVYFNR